ncbi:MAG: phage shock protein operon transcriptional activator [Deltaproteobacteria bacterium]
MNDHFLNTRIYAKSTVGNEALGQSEAFLSFQEKLSRVAGVNRPVLVIGERGTGKELAAIRLHYLSPRWREPLVTLNCAALSPTLMETELFGHEKGAFTGALRQRVGRFEAADGGTLFLDEVGAVPVQVQEKILRVVEYGSFERVGGSKEVDVDVRLIGATNADLKAMADEGRFKRDLLDRLSFEVLFLPPLRDREGDIAFLADHFARRMAMELGREKVPLFSESAMACLNRHLWPGNVRELKNVVERAVYRSKTHIIETVELDPFHSPYAPQQEEKQRPPAAQPWQGDAIDFRQQPLKTAVAHLENYLVQNALKATRYNQKKAADRLGLTYDQFRGIYRKYRKDAKHSKASGFKGSRDA